MIILTKDTLDRANAINNRLGKVNAWLDGLDETDPSGIDTQSRYSPIILSCGIAKTLDLAHSPEVETDVQRLDNQLRAFIVAQVRGYKQQLEKLLEEL